jgi:hypothetical protein
VATNTDVFIGASSQNATQSMVDEIMPANVSFGHFYCASQKQGAGTSVIFKLHQCVPNTGSTYCNPDSVVATCTVATGAVTASTSGSFSLVAGDAYDVEVQTGNTAGAVTASLGP